METTHLINIMVILMSKQMVTRTFKISINITNKKLLVVFNIE